MSVLFLCTDIFFKKWDSTHTIFTLFLFGNLDSQDITKSTGRSLRPAAMTVAQYPYILSRDLLHNSYSRVNVLLCIKYIWSPPCSLVFTPQRCLIFNLPFLENPQGTLLSLKVKTKAFPRNREALAMGPLPTPNPSASPRHS